jgi:hypothetical protein
MPRGGKIPQFAKRNNYLGDFVAQAHDAKL